MSAVDGLSSTTLTSLNGSSTKSATSTDNAAAQKSEFMNLLVAQMQNQDPLNPTDSTQFVSQLAQFSALEQQATTNDKLDSMQQAQEAAARSNLVAMVGKTVTANASSLSVDASGGSPPLSVHLDGPAKSCTVSLVDATGKTVRSIDLGAQGGGDIPVNWTASGGAVPGGNYTVQVKATAPDGSAVNASAQIKGIVTSLGFNNGVSTFDVGGAQVNPSDIVSVGN
jgi:flagellar basal-body rod modification protein FlgD